MRFADPAVLLLLLLPLALAWRAWRRRRQPPPGALPFPVHALGSVPRPLRARVARLPAWLAWTGLALLVVALARPQLAEGTEEVRLSSRNLIVALDISSSMKAADFEPVNRLTAAREILRQFVRRREGDLVGLVVFSGRAFLRAPLTDDLALLDRLLADVDLGQLPDGTAIGTALALGLNQLKDLPPRTSAVVLITDGANNTGTPSLPQATEMARALGIRVHAIGLSAADTTAVALNSVWSVRTRASRLTSQDEATLRRVAERTGGRYARATSPGALDSIMAGIDPLEKREVVVRETRLYRELAPWVAAAAVLALAAGRLLAATWLRSAT